MHMKYENTSATANKTGWDKSVVRPDQVALRRTTSADFHPRMTLADARGKILFVIREDYKSAERRPVSRRLPELDARQGGLRHDAPAATAWRNGPDHA